MKILRAPGVDPPFGAQMTAFGRVAWGLGLATLGALAMSATARALFRPGRSSPADGARRRRDPDIFLDVTELEVDKLNLEVDDLKAHVAILAELANLVGLSVGVDARLAGVKLEIEGVKATVLLKARLEHVRAILEKALDTIAEHPEILRILGRPLRVVVRDVREAQAALSELLEGLEVGETVDEQLRDRLEKVRESLDAILERQEVESGDEVSRRALGGDSAHRTASSA
jgi:hypothetical protein